VGAERERDTPHGTKPLLSAPKMKKKLVFLLCLSKIGPQLSPNGYFFKAPPPSGLAHKGSTFFDGRSKLHLCPFFFIYPQCFFHSCVFVCVSLFFQLASIGGINGVKDRLKVKTTDFSLQESSLDVFFSEGWEDSLPTGNVKKNGV